MEFAIVILRIRSHLDISFQILDFVVFFDTEKLAFIIFTFNILLLLF